jgi:branched-chain amino acid transport system ATP-binding protein
MASGGLLQVRGANVTFGGVRAVRDVDLDVAAGSITGLIGPNGAGKSTTFDVITGLLDATGTIRFDGRDITRLPPHRRARLGIGRTFQRLEVFGSMTVRENILTAAETKHPWSAGKARTLTEEVIERVHLAAHAEHEVGALSTGIARLVELGRALATEPRLVLLDEPASGLDDAESEELADLLLELAGDGTAVLLVEHDIDLIMKVCGRIYVLNFGEILACGTPDEIKNDQRVLDAYLGTTT